MAFYVQNVKRIEFIDQYQIHILNLVIALNIGHGLLAWRGAMSAEKRSDKV